MSEKDTNTRSKSASSQRSEFDSPAKPKPEEKSPICSGGSQNVPLSTWTTFDASKCAEEVAQAGETVKKEKDKKSSYKKFHKGLKKAIIGKKSSDHAGKKEEKISQEYKEEKISEATPAEHEEVRSHGDLIYLPGEDQDHLLTQPKKESLRAKPVSSRLADELEQRRQELQNEVSQLEKDKREFNARMEIWNVESRKERKTLERRNRELEEGLENSKAKLDQMEIHSEEETKEPSDLKEVTAMLTFELKSIKSQLIRAESEHSDIGMEKSALKKEMKKLEEENLKQQTEAAQLKEKLEFWQKKCENEGIYSKTTAQTGVLIVNLLQIELMELEKKLLRKENEVQTMAECRKKLEEQLLITRQERNRQHDQIMRLLALKSNLTEEVDRSYDQHLGEFKEKSQQLKKTLGMRINEVAGLKEEKAALVKEMESMKEEIETRKVELSVIRKDLEEECKERERMASEIDIAQVKWEVTRQELFDAAGEDLKKEKMQTEYIEAKFNKACKTWNIERSEYGNEIHALTDQVELLQIKVEELSLCIDQDKKEYNAKLSAIEGRLLKERQEREQTLKELNHVNELLQCSQQDFNSRLAEANAINEELKLDLAVTSADKSSIQDELMKLQEEIDAKKSQYEYEKSAAEKTFNKLCEYSDELKQTLDAAIEDLKKDKKQMEYMETQLNKAREIWNIKQSEYENEIQIQTDNVELLIDKVEELSLFIDQSKKESDAKLTVAEGRLLKERQKYEQTLEELNCVTELLHFNSRQAEANAIHEELKLNLAVMSADKSRFQDEMKQLQEEMDVKKSQYESEISAAKKKFNELCEYSDQLQQMVDQLNAQYSNENQGLKMQNMELKQKLEQIEWLNAQYDNENQGLKMQNVGLKHKLKQHKRDCLENYEIKVVQCIKDEVGSGSYGSISMVSVNGMPCIQKRLHNILVGLSGTEAVSPDQQKNISDKFYDECILLWKMRHPNIVQFMGIHYYGRADEKHKISLIMEYLPTNAEECIKKCNEARFCLPLSIKFSILRDVAYGLSHLHANDIIHRDLSAANVLLTDSLRAKIADLGVSKLVPPDAYNKFTVSPGAQYIMPPEALEENPHYSTKLDIFSYAILSLYLILQKEPRQTKSTLKPEHVKTRQIEIGCRMSHIQQLQRINSGLGRIVIQSLLDEPESRPNAAKLSEDITSCICRAKFDFYSDLTTFIKLMGKKVLVSNIE